MRQLAPIVLILLWIAGPATAACADQLTVTIHDRSIDVEALATLRGDEAHVVRTIMDANDDGVLASDEVEAFQGRASVDSVPAHAACRSVHDVGHIDGSTLGQPQQVRVHTDLHGATLVDDHLVGVTATFRIPLSSAVDTAESLRLHLANARGSPFVSLCSWDAFALWAASECARPDDDPSLVTVRSSVASVDLTHARPGDVWNAGSTPRQGTHRYASGAMWHDAITISVAPATEAPGFAVAVGVSLAALGALGIASWYGPERLRFAIGRWWVAAAALTRRARSPRGARHPHLADGDHPRRMALRRLVSERPGLHLGALQRATGLATGALVYHLRTMRSRGDVVVVRDGNRMRFYPPGAHEAEPPLDWADVLILRVLARGPHTQTQTARALGKARSTIAYRVRRLVARRLVAKGTECGRLVLTEKGAARLDAHQPRGQEVAGQVDPATAESP